MPKWRPLTLRLRRRPGSLLDFARMKTASGEMTSCRWKNENCSEDKTIAPALANAPGATSLHGGASLPISSPIFIRALRVPVLRCRRCPKITAKRRELGFEISITGSQCVDHRPRSWRDGVRATHGCSEAHALPSTWGQTHDVSVTTIIPPIIPPIIYNNSYNNNPYNNNPYAVMYGRYPTTMFATDSAPITAQVPIQHTTKTTTKSPVPLINRMYPKLKCQMIGVFHDESQPSSPKKTKDVRKGVVLLIGNLDTTAVGTTRSSSRVFLLKRTRRSLLVMTFENVTRVSMGAFGKAQIQGQGLDGVQALRPPGEAEVPSAASATPRRWLLRKTSRLASRLWKSRRKIVKTRWLLWYCVHQWGHLNNAEIPRPLRSRRWLLRQTSRLASRLWKARKIVKTQWCDIHHQWGHLHNLPRCRTPLAEMTVEANVKALTGSDRTR